MTALILALTIMLMSPTLALGNGFIKNPGEFYTKLSQSQTNREPRTDQNILEPIKQHEIDRRFYGELGLGLPWKSQIIASAVHKSITVEDLKRSDQFTSAAFGDSTLELKNRIGQLDLFGIQTHIAASFGLRLPTTRKRFRNDHTADRAHEAPDGRELLISPIDTGRLGIIYGLGASVLYKFAWLNLSHQSENDTTGLWTNLKASADLGFALPYNSWASFGVSQFRTKGLADQFTPDQGSLTVTQSAGLGITVWQGLALELNYASMKDNVHYWQTQKAYEFGISYRSI